MSQIFVCLTDDLADSLSLTHTDDLADQPIPVVELAGIVGAAVVLKSAVVSGTVVVLESVTTAAAAVVETYSSTRIHNIL